MLTELSVQNLALVDSVRIEFGQGMNVLSGETGAGKSIVVGALDLLAGGKASSLLVRPGAKEAIIEGIFETGSELLKLLEEMGLEDGDQLILRRQVSAESKNRIYANGKSITLSQLQKISELLLDLTSQHDQQILLKPSQHAALLDAAIPNLQFQKKLVEYREVYAQYRAALNHLETLKLNFAQRESKMLELQRQLREIESAKLTDEAEEESLLAEKKRSKNLANLQELADWGMGSLAEGEESALNKIRVFEKKWQRALDLDEKLQALTSDLNAARDALENLSHFLSKYQQEVAVPPQRLDEIESRLFLIYKLKQVYGGTVAEIQQVASQKKEELQTLENLDVRLEEAEKVLDEISKTLLKLAKGLSKDRKAAAQTLSAQVNAELLDLSMKGVVFQVSVLTPENLDLSACGPQGADEVRFEVSNAGSSYFRRLDQVASGGEVSRLLLALKVVLQKNDTPKTLVFDEVDAGIGGAVAEAVGKKLQALAETHQVLCVTHWPQVASHAQSHFIVEKELTSDKTISSVRRLQNTQERENEIARMLGGAEITKTTRQHAREMLKKIQTS